MPSVPPRVESRSIRTGIIGFGMAGRVFHAPILQANSSFDLTAIATTDPTRAAQATAQTGAAVMSVDQLLDRVAGGELDMVIIASPPHVHREHAVAALEAGAAVVVDKPFATTVEDAKAIIEASERTRLPVTVFQNRRWDGDFLTISRLVQEGTLGRVHRFESTFERFGGAENGLWQAELSSARGGGILFNLGSHLIDQALMLFGPASLQTVETRTVREGIKNEEDAFLSLLHENGVRTHLTMSRVAAQTGPRFRVLGDKSGYCVSGLDGQEAALQRGEHPDTPNYGLTSRDKWGLLGIDSAQETPSPIPTEKGAYPAFYAQVAECLLAGGSVPVDPASVLDTLRIIQEAHGAALIQ